MKGTAENLMVKVQACIYTRRCNGLKISVLQACMLDNFADNMLKLYTQLTMMQSHVVFLTEGA